MTIAVKSNTTISVQNSMEKIIDEDEDVFYSPQREMDPDVEEEEETNDKITYDININEEEKKKMGLMRGIVEKQDPPCKETDDLTLRRFLHARDLNVDKAVAMFLKYINWRRTYVPRGSIPASEITNELAQNKMFIQGKDKNGSPISVVLGARHFPRKEGTEEFKRFVVFTLDKLCSRIPAGQEKFTIIGDLRGYGYCNSDVRAYLAALCILQDYYPERLGRIFLIHVPYIFMTVWKIVCPFIDKNTRKKFIFVENKRMHDTLREYIDESQLPDIYGGKLQLVPIQDV